MKEPFDIVMIGLTITSSWGNGHATTYRSLARGLAARGRRVLFLERNLPWYAENRDEPHPEGISTELFSDCDDLINRFETEIVTARFVIVGSFVREGRKIGEWVTSVARRATAFYDIDTPVTLSQLEAGEREYISPSLIQKYGAYFSFTGGPTLNYLESHFGAPIARALYCSVDPLMYRPVAQANRWDLGYLGTYSPDRQPALESYLLQPARRCPEGRFAVVGAMYPDEIRWPKNVYRDIHLSPRDHSAFYSAQRFTLNLTRAEMKKRGYSPSVRLFEAGACGVPIISDWWDGLEHFFVPGREILISLGAEDTLRYLHDVSDARRAAIGQAARARILAEHTPEHRAFQLEQYLKEINDNALPGAPRRNGLGRQDAHRLDSGVSSESGRAAAGGGVSETTSSARCTGNIYEPTRKSGGNGGGDREGLHAETAAVSGTRRDEIRGVGRTRDPGPGSG